MFSVDVKRGSLWDTWSMKSVHSPLSGKVASFGYPFSQAKHSNKSLLLGKVSASEALIRDGHLTQSLMHHLLTHEPQVNSHSTLYLWHHSHITPYVD